MIAYMKHLTGKKCSVNGSTSLSLSPTPGPSSLRPLILSEEVWHRVGSVFLHFHVYQKLLKGR